MRIYLLVFAIPMTFCTYYGFSQKKNKESPYIELAKISDRYEHIANLNFKVKYTYTDSANENKILDTSSVEFSIAKGQIQSNNEKVEIVSAKDFYVYVDKETKNIYLYKNQKRSILQIPLTDSLFQRAHIQEMHVKKIDDSTSKLIFSFKKGSFYHGYELIYQSNSDLIKQIKYYIPSLGKYSLDKRILCIKIDFDSYNVLPVDASVFDKQRFFKKSSNTVLLQSVYQQYKLHIN